MAFYKYQIAGILCHPVLRLFVTPLIADRAPLAAFDATPVTLLAAPASPETIGVAGKTMDPASPDTDDIDGNFGMLMPGILPAENFGTNTIDVTVLALKSGFLTPAIIPDNPDGFAGIAGTFGMDWSDTFGNAKLGSAGADIFGILGADIDGIDGIDVDTALESTVGAGVIDGIEVIMIIDHHRGRGLHRLQL